MSVLAEQVVNRSTLFIFAKAGPVKALSWPSARYLIESFEPVRGASAQQCSGASFSGNRGVSSTKPNTGSGAWLSTARANEDIQAVALCYSACLIAVALPFSSGALFSGVASFNPWFWPRGVCLFHPGPCHSTCVWSFCWRSPVAPLPLFLALALLFSEISSSLGGVACFSDKASWSSLLIAVIIAGP